MFSHLTLVVAHLVGNGLLLLIAYRWLSIDESDGGHLLGSFAVAAGVVLAFSWLHGWALAKFSGFDLQRAAVRSLKKLLPIALICLLAIASYAALAWVQASYAREAFVIASFLTMHLRIAVPPLAIQNIFHIVVLALEWSLIPAALLLLAARITAASPHRLRIERMRSSTFLLFAIAVATILFCGIWVPLKLFFWVPGIIAFSGQFASFVLRVGAGYLLFVSCMLLVEFITARGKPVETQPSTAV